MKIDPLSLAFALLLLWTPLMFFAGIGVTFAVAAGLYLLPLLITVGAQTPVAFMLSRSALDRVREPHARL